MCLACKCPLNGPPSFPIISVQGPNAVNFYAKGAVAYIAMLQQLIIMGSMNSENTTLTGFAGQAADWLQDRYDFYTTWTNMLPAVQRSSSTPYVDNTMNVMSSCDSNGLLDRHVYMVGCLFCLSHVCVHTTAGIPPTAATGCAVCVSKCSTHNTLVCTQVVHLSADQYPGGQPWILFSGDNLAGVMEGSTDPNTLVWIAQNLSAPICTSNPDCQWVTVDHVGCLYRSTWNSTFCLDLGQNVTTWAQLMNCTSCGNPSNKVVGVDAFPPDDNPCQQHNYDYEIDYNRGRGFASYYPCSNLPRNVDSWQVCSLASVVAT